MMEHLTPPDQVGGGENAMGRGFDKDHHQQLHHGGSCDGFMALDSLDKIQVEFGLSDLAGIEGMLDSNTDDLDKLLAKEAAVGDIDNEDNSNIMSSLNLDQLNLELCDNLSRGDEDSESSMDKLLSMNIIEVDDAEKQLLQRSTDGHNSDLMQEFAKGFLAQQENNVVQHQRFSDGNDSLLGRLSAHGEHIAYEQQLVEQMQVLHQQQQLMMIKQQQQEYELQQQTQMMQLQAMMQQNGIVEREETLTSAKVSQLASMGSEDLEREKLKLLTRLQEINSRQRNSMTMMQPKVGSQETCFAGIEAANSSVVSAMGKSGSSSSGETPLSAFLRNKNKSGGAVLSQASVLSQQVNPGVQPAASILDVAPMDFAGTSNPFLRQAAGGGNPLVSAMNKSSSSQNMIRHSFSGRNLQASGVSLNRRSGQNLMDMLSSDLGRGNNRNTSMGSTGIANHRRTGVSSFSSSGILQRHVSDGSLLSGATTVSASLAKTKNRVGSLSRENSLYNMLKTKQGSHKTLNSLVRQSSHSRLSKSGSRGSMSKNDSFGSLLPAKRGGGRVGPKYKIGTSTSVPQLMVRGSPNHIGQGANAMW